MKMIYGPLLASVLWLQAADSIAAETMNITMSSCNTVARTCTHTVTTYTRNYAGQWQITSVYTFTTPMPHTPEEPPIE